MMKGSVLFLVSALFTLVSSCRVLAVEPYVGAFSAPTATLQDGEQGVVVAVADETYHIDCAAVGAPALPLRTVLVAIPDRAAVTGMTFAVAWETLAEKVRLAPVTDPVRVGDATPVAVADAAIYAGSAPYPAVPVQMGAEERSCGVRLVPIRLAPFRWHPASGLLERATHLSVTLGFSESGERSFVIADGMLGSVREAVVNPDVVTLEPKAVSRRLTATRARVAAATPTADERADYLLLSPPDFVNDWTWYVGKRKAVHPAVTFKVKNTAEIYDEYSFGESNACRNAAESIHAYLRDHRDTMKFSYVVLGGAWIDAQNRKNTTPHFYGGETMTLSNCVPGVYGYPREDWREIPSDMFYACLDMKPNQKYPWDYNADGIYIDQNDCSNNDLRPDVCVTRLTLNPYRPNGWTAYNRHVLVTNYVDKLARGEAKDFHGHFRYGLSPDSTGSRRLRSNGDRMYYDELEFYDNMYNMFDPNHADWIEDNEVEPRRRIKDQFAKWRPVLEAKGMMNFTWTKGFATLAAATDDYYASDRDYGFVYSHGWAQGATHFQAYRFATCKGLTILNGSNGPCDTGYVDYHVNMSGVATLQYNLGDSGVTNPDGGALASINNTRWGWAGGNHTGQDFDSSMSYFMLNRSLIGFNNMYKDVGHAWFKGVSDYAAFGFTQGGGTHTWTLTEQICYGDPLVRLPAPENRWWTAGTTGRWDYVTSNWSNDVEAVATYYSASNACFAVTGDTTIVVAETVGALRLNASCLVHPAPSTSHQAPLLSFVGESNGNLRVMQSLTVAGADLRLNVPGGVGHEGVIFTREEWNERDPILTFEGTHPFYVANVRGADRINMNGGGVTLDVDNFPSPSTPPAAPFLVFDGPGINYIPTPNILRADCADALRRFGSLALTNTYVKLATADGFGRADPLTHTLAHSKLEIAANAFYQKKGAYQVDGYGEKLNGVFNVAGKSEVTSSKGGLWTVSATTTFNLEPDATLALSAETKNCGGKIILSGAGTVTAKSASALCGTVEVKAGTTLVLDKLPLDTVTSLNVADGAKIVLPDQKSGYWQILPVSSRLICGAGVQFFTASDRTRPLDGTPSQSGSFFKKGALYTWQDTDTHWSAAIAHTEPKVLFGDLTPNCFTVAVDLAVAPSFVSFANARTAYRFCAASSAPSATITFSSVILNGDTRFTLPVSATEYAEALAGRVGFSRIIAPYVRIGADAALELAGTHWTRFILEDGARLCAVPGESLDWNGDTQIEIAATTPVEIDVSSLTLSSTPQVLIQGSGHTWTVADLARFTAVGQDAELRIVEGTLCVVQGAGLVSPYTLAFDGETNWNSRAWHAANAPFGANWSALTLNDAAAIYVTSTDLVARLTLDCSVVGDTLALACPTNGAFTLDASGAEAHLGVVTIDLTDAGGVTRIALDTGDAAILSPTNAESVCTLAGIGTGLITLREGELRICHPGIWSLAAGAQGNLVVTLPPTNKVATLVHLAEGFEYPCGGFAVKIVDGDGIECTDVSVVKEGDELVAVPRQIDVSDVDFDELVSNAVAGAPYSYWLVRGELSDAVSVTNLPTFLGDGTNITVETLGTEGVRLLVSAPATRLGSINVNFCGGRNNQSIVSESRVSDNATYMYKDHGVHPIVGTNWNDVAAANGTFTLSRLILAGGTVETNAAVTLVAANVNNPYTTGRVVGDQILFGYIDDSKHPVVTLAGIPFARYRIIAYRATDHQNTVFSACRMGASAADARAYYGAFSGGAMPSATLSGEANRGWGTTNARDKLLEGVNYVVSDVLTGGTAYIQSPKHTGRACLAAIQVVEVAGSVEPPPTPPVEPVHEIRTAADAKQLAESDFDGEVRLVDGVNVELHGLPAFTLVTGSVGRVEVRFTAAPTENGMTLLATAGDYDPASNAVEVVVRDQFGNPFVAPVSVRWERGRYYLLVQNLDAVAYRHTFTGTVTDPNYNSTGLPETSDPAHFENCRTDGQALIDWYRGSTQGPLMNPFPTSWTLNLVARTPNNQNGVLFGFGYGGYSPKGFCFAAQGTDQAAMCIWKHWNVTQRLKANVSLATTQYHCYTLTYDGATLSFYVDGVLRDSCIDTEGFTFIDGVQNDKVGWFQFWGLCSGRYPSDGEGSLTGASGGAVDDFAFYRTCLTPESVEALAARFPAWPQTSTATIYEPGSQWSKLLWEPAVENWANLLAAQIEGSGEAGASAYCDEPAFSNKLVMAEGARLIASNTVGFALAPYPVGAMEFILPSVASSCRLVNTTSDFACDDASFSISVCAADGSLPPDPWHVTRCSDGWYWLRLQNINAPRYACTFNGAWNTALDDVPVPALNDNDNCTFVASRGHAKGALTGRNPYFASPLGTYANWTMHTVAQMPETPNGIIFAYGQKDHGLALYTPSNDTVAVGCWSSAAKRDDLITVAVTNAQLQYHAYALVHTGSRVVLYVDGVWRGESASGGYPGNGNAQFFSVHGGMPSGFANGQAGAIDDWRFYDEVLAPRGIAMLANLFQPWPEYGCVYSARLARSTPWADGAGTGLVHDVAWQNATNALLTLTMATNAATLTLDTALTTSLFKVESAFADRLRLVATAAPLALGTFNLAAATGETILTNWPAALIPVVGTGTRLRYEDAVSAPRITSASSIVAYRDATFNAHLSNYGWVLRTEEPADHVTIKFSTAFTQHVAIDVAGGLVEGVMANPAESWYGGNTSGSTNSVIAVNGGTFRCNATGMGLSAVGSRGFLIGTTYNKRQNPTLVVNDGLFDCSTGQLTPWEYGIIVQNGGLLRAKRIYKGGNAGGSMRLAGGITEVGAGGMGANDKSRFPTTLAGGTIRCVANATVDLNIALTAPSTLAATKDTTLTVNGAMTGSGAAALTLGAPAWGGQVVIANATALGDVTIAEGASARLPMGAVTGNLAVGEGATLDITHAGAFADVTNLICTGTLTLPDTATFTLNGEPLSKNCRREGNTLIITADPRTWANPVTGERQDFTYRFVGCTSGAWLAATNWQKYATFDWLPLAQEAKIPMVHEGDYAATVVDGADITNAAYRVVTLAGTMEGWEPRLAVMGGAHVTVQTLGKLQQDPKWFWVDAQSALTVNSMGNGTYDGTLALYVAATNGITFMTDFDHDGTTIAYHLTGAGCVRYAAALTKGAHLLARADFTLRRSGRDRIVREKRLVAFPSTTAAWTLSGATITVIDPVKNVTAAVAKDAITAADALGTYALEQRADGIYLRFVDRDGEPETGFMFLIALHTPPF